MACEPSRRDSYSRKLAAEDTLSKHLLDQSPSADAVMHAAHRTAWHSLLTRFSTLQVPSPTTTLCAHSPHPALGLPRGRGAFAQDWDKGIARTLQRIEDKKRLGALKRSPPPLPQRDAQRAKTGVNALTFTTPRDGPPQGPSPPTPVPPTAGRQEHGTKRRMSSGLTGGITSLEEHEDSRNRTCALPQCRLTATSRCEVRLAPHRSKRARSDTDHARGRRLQHEARRQSHCSTARAH